MPIAYPGNFATKPARAKSGGGFESAIALPAGALTLASSNYVPRKLDMLPIYPVDASETVKQPASTALFKNARPGLKYEVPIVVAFGAYPFSARKISGPSWLTVGSSMTLANGVYTESDDYLTISGTPPTESEGTYTVTVGVTDQDYQRGANPSSELQISYTLTVSNSMHVFVAPTATGAGDGSSPNDCAAYTALYAGDTTVSLGQGKIAVWRGGAYTNPFGTISPAYHALTHIAYQAEAPDIDLATGFIIDADDVVFTGFTFRNGVDKPIQYFKGSNSGFWRCSYLNFTRTNATDNNEATLFAASNDPNFRSRIFVRECDYSEIGDVSAHVFYSIDGSLVERNTFGNSLITSRDRRVTIPKFAMKRHCIRRNLINYPNVDFTAKAAIEVYLADASSADSEVCYNLVLTGANGGAIAFNGSTASTSDTNWSYRNTYVNGKVVVREFFTGAAAREVTLQNDVIQNAAGTVQESGGGEYLYTNTGIECQGTSGIVDASGKLTGTFRTQYLGLRGYEIAGESV